MCNISCLIIRVQKSKYKCLKESMKENSLHPGSGLSLVPGLPGSSTGLHETSTHPL